MLEHKFIKCIHVLKAKDKGKHYSWWCFRAVNKETENLDVLPPSRYTVCNIHSGQRQVSKVGSAHVHNSTTCNYIKMIVTESQALITRYGTSLLSNPSFLSTILVVTERDYHLPPDTRSRIALNSVPQSHMSASTVSIIISILVGL